MAHTPVGGQLPFFCVIRELTVHSLRCAGDGEDHHRNVSANQAELCAPTITRKAVYIKSCFGTYITSFLITHFLLEVYQKPKANLTCVEHCPKLRILERMCGAVCDCVFAKRLNKNRNVLLR